MRFSAPAVDLGFQTSGRAAAQPRPAVPLDSKDRFARPALLRAVIPYASAVTLCLALLAWVMHLRHADLFVPLQDYTGDTLLTQMWVKGIIEKGWYLSNDALGMPYGLDMRDFPMADNLHFFLIKLIALAVPDAAFAHNLYWLLGFPLTTVTTLFALRHLAVSTGVAIVGSILFAFLPCHFMRGTAHVFLASYYLVPPMSLVLLWLYRGGGPFFILGEAGRIHFAPLRGKSLAAVAICLLHASAGVYYAFFASFLALIAGLACSLHRRRVYPLLAAALVIALIGGGVTANIAPSLAFRLQHGHNRLAAPRDPSHAEVYGLKIAQLVLPLDNHRLPPLARLKHHYDSTTPLLNENTMATLGLVGSLGFLVLLGRLIYRRAESSAQLRLAARSQRLFDGLSLLTIAAVLLGTVGGLGSLFAWFVSQEIRGYNRISVFIGFFAFAAVALLLDRLARRFHRWKGGQVCFHGLLAVLLVLGILDQTAPHFAPPYQQLRAEYQHDREFVAQIEASLPAGAMVFQYPIRPFLEREAVHEMRHFDHFRAYLHSKKLRWSYGALTGREGDAWQTDLASKPLAEQVITLSRVGFDGIYIDRGAYADRAASMEAELEHMLAVRPLVSANGRFSCFSMDGFNRAQMARCSPAEWDEQRQQALKPVVALWQGGFGELESNPELRWRWCAEGGELVVFNLSRESRTCRVEFRCQTGRLEAAHLKIESPWFVKEWIIDPQGQELRETFVVPPGRHRIAFRCDGRRLEAPNDGRALVFRVINPCFTAE